MVSSVIVTSKKSKDIKFDYRHRNSKKAKPVYVGNNNNRAFCSKSVDLLSRVCLVIRFIHESKDN